MKTGIIRRVDDLGRVVIPKDIRRNFGIAEGDELEISVNGKMICFQKVSNKDEVKLDVLGALLESANIMPFVLCNADGEIVNTWATELVDNNAHFSDYTFKVGNDTVAFLSLPIDEENQVYADNMVNMCKAYFQQYED